MLPQYPRIMGYSESITTITTDIGSWSFAKVQAHVRMYQAEVAIDQDAASTTSKGVAIAYPAQYLHCYL